MDNRIYNKATEIKTLLKFWENEKSKLQDMLNYFESSKNISPTSLLELRETVKKDLSSIRETVQELNECFKNL